LGFIQAELGKIVVHIVGSSLLGRAAFRDVQSQTLALLLLRVGDFLIRVELFRS
jgi:hypothetical protein